MTVDELTRRRYLLGECSEDECVALEQIYMDDVAEQERIATAEEDLIEDYIAGSLEPDQRQRFETHYLAAPRHRERLETTRHLLAASAALPRVDHTHPLTAVPAPETARPWTLPVLALAAALVLIVAGAAWFVKVGQDKPPVESVTSAPADRSLPAPPVQAPPSPSPGLPPSEPTSTARVFAVTLSVSALRSSDDQRPVVIPAGTEVLTVRLEANGAQDLPRLSSVVVRTVGGAEIWRGALTTDAGPGLLGRIEIPANLLAADDYIVTLLESSARGVDQEVARYFMRVRTR